MIKSSGLRQNMLVIYIVFGLVLIAVIFPILNISVTQMEEDLIASRLVSDIHYIEDLIGEGDWTIRNGSICCGDTVIGDGTQARANLAPFLLHEKKTGTFSYVFIRCGDEGLTYVESTPNQAGYQQGHFLRVAGSTKDPNGQSIVGTYMDKVVADILDEHDVFNGEANVAGGMIYCHYETLKNPKGETIGAIVVGRSIEELRGQIGDTIRSVVYAGLFGIVLGSALLLLLINRWVVALGNSTMFLQKIETGDIPKDRLMSHGLREIDILNQGINSLADTLTENEELRIKSETDELTGLANRFGLNHYGEEMFNACVAEKHPLALGVLDIDYFKLYNDHYGHQSGDDCMVRVARVLHDVQKEGKILSARFGGDEFIVLAKCKERDEVIQLADRIRSGILDEKIPHAYSPSSSIVTLSQGYCMAVPQEGQSLSSFLLVADKVMYEVKNGTRNDYKIRAWSEADVQSREEIPDPARATDIVWSSYHDYLTQLLNQDGFLMDVSRILENNPQEEYYIVRSNIREFKLVNQLYGYDQGNKILIETADFLKNELKNAVSIGRLQGDHFAFLIPKKDFKEAAIRDTFLSLSKSVEGPKYILKFHLGVYPIHDRSIDVSIMCDGAKLAINSIHNESNIAIAYYDDSMMEDILWENVVISEFENALKAGEYRIFLQPIFNQDKSLAGAEALVRWVRNDATIYPTEFIGVLEKTNLIHKLDAYVWEEAAKIIKGWNDTFGKELFISVNVSPQDDDFLSIVNSFVGLTERYGINPKQLNPEFTETTLISDPKRYIKLVSSLQKKGFRVEIDDFGTGYSSLNMLNDIKADVLKLDRLFVSKTKNRDRTITILASIINMSKNLNMKVIAEGVETEAQFRTLRNIDCDLFQGFYFSKAIPKEEFERMYL